MRHVILNLHGLGAPGRDLPDPAEARYWLTEEAFRSALREADRHSGTVRTAITFDDGNRSDLQIGARVLAEFGRSATFFVLSARIGEPHYLSAADLRDLVAQGHRIGCHGADHVPWTGLDDAGLQREIVAARALIAQAAGTEVAEAALPLGRYDARVLQSLRRAGYARVYSSDGGAVTDDRWPIPRSSLTRDMTAGDVTDVLLGRESLRRRLRRRLARAVKRRV